jgi:succinate dehydrogenase/fumarate reductase cytochrome b subunit
MKAPVADHTRKIGLQVLVEIGWLLACAGLAYGLLWLELGAGDWDRQYVYAIPSTRGPLWVNYNEVGLFEGLFIVVCHICYGLRSWAIGFRKRFQNILVMVSMVLNTLLVLVVFVIVPLLPEVSIFHDDFPMQVKAGGAVIGLLAVFDAIWIVSYRRCRRTTHTLGGV